MKLVLALLIVATLFSPVAFAAKDTKFGQAADQQVSVKIAENGDAHITHVVKANEDNSQQVPYVSINFVNFTIVNSKGSEPQYAEAGGTSPGVVVFPSKRDTTIQYDVPGFVKLHDKLWTLDYLYLADSAFYLPESVKLFYANNNLVQFKDEKGFDCHGCQIKLEYELKPTIVTKQVTWEDKTFDVKVLTLTDMPELKLDQKNMSLNFDVTQPKEHITLIIPKELLGNPYYVSLNDKLIKKQERIDTEGKIWLHIMPTEKGHVRIQGVSVVPEFPLASVLVFSVSMIAVVYVSRLNRR